MAGAALIGGMVAGPAGAITGGATLTAVSKPQVGAGQTNQPAGNLTITPATPTNTFAVNEQIVIRVDDADADPNCSPTPPSAVTSDFVAFSSVPTVSISGSATATASIRPQASGQCAGASRNDELVITFNTAGTATVTISNIRYDVGARAATGDVRLFATTSAVDPITLSPANTSNATVVSVRVTANNPPVGVRAGSGIQSISGIVLSEQAADALATNSATETVCIRLVEATDVFDATAPAPTVGVSPGAGDTATVSFTEANRSLEVQIKDVSNTDTAASTFTISGLRVGAATTNTIGQVTADVLAGPCATATVRLAEAVVLGAVVDTERFGGSDRFTTAQILFEDAFPCGGATGLPVAIIARGDLFPDALAASYLAGKNNTGILLVDPRTPNELPPATVNTLRSRGVASVIIVGGETAVPASLATLLDDLPNVNCAGATEASPNNTIAVSRVSGADRYETARNVAERPGLGGAGTADFDGTAADPDGPTCNPRKTAILATGENFPDALVAGAVAYGGAFTAVGTCGDGEGFPLILTTGNALHPQAAAALNNLGIQQVLVMGGPTAISPGVVTSVQGINAITTRRFDGATRLDTAKRFAEFAIDFLGYDADSVSVARGDEFPDALAGGPHAIENPDVGHAVILLTESASSVGTETAAFFRERQGTAGVLGAPNPLIPIDAVDIYGGPLAISDATVASILAAISQA